MGERNTASLILFQITFYFFLGAAVFLGAAFLAAGLAAFLGVLGFLALGVLGFFGGGLLSLLGGLGLLDLLCLGLLGFLCLGLLGLLCLGLLGFLGQLVGSLNLDQSLAFDSLFQSLADEGGNFNDVNLVVGGDVLLDGGQR